MTTSKVGSLYDFSKQTMDVKPRIDLDEENKLVIITFPENQYYLHSLTQNMTIWTKKMNWF